MRTLRAVLAAAALALLAVPAASATTIAPRVVGGAPADIAAMPWMVALQLSSRSGDSWLCGGSVVASRYVLTAAHCVVDHGAVVRAADVHGAVGRADLSADDGVTFSATAIAVHPLYDRHDDVEGGPYDAALLRVDAELTATPLRLATVADADAYRAGRVATIAGWGATRSGGYVSDQLLAATVPIVSDATCARENGISLAEARKMICAGNEAGGVDTCQGDSGGPLTVVAGSETILAGIVSWGFECASARHPGVYTRAAMLAPWISPLLADDARAWRIATDVSPPRPRPRAALAQGRRVRFRYSIAGETGRTRETITIRRARAGRALRTLTTRLASNHQVDVVRWTVPRGFAAGRYLWCVVSQDESLNTSPMRCAPLVIGG